MSGHDGADTIVVRPNFDTGVQITVLATTATVEPYRALELAGIILDQCAYPGTFVIAFGDIHLHLTATNGRELAVAIARNADIILTGRSR